jgi:hypothetical protein
LLEQSKGDPDGLAGLHRDHFELIYNAKAFRLDEGLTPFELKSNRKLKTLQRLVELLDDSGQAPAAHQALRRYTRESFEAPGEWQTWFKTNRDRIFFTDVGGYRFLRRQFSSALRTDLSR